MNIEDEEQIILMKELLGRKESSLQVLELQVAELKRDIEEVKKDFGMDDD